MNLPPHKWLVNRPHQSPAPNVPLVLTMMVNWTSPHESADSHGGGQLTKVRCLATDTATLIFAFYKYMSNNKSLYICRDKDNNSVILPPLEVHVDVVSSTARFHNSGDHAETSQGRIANPGSPTSSRSVNFAIDSDNSTRRSKRYSCNYFLDNKVTDN